jgi:hypothetical protein
MADRDEKGRILPGSRPCGRNKGVANKATMEVREFARGYGAKAIEELARLAFNSASEQTKVAAIKELPDRGYGKSVQGIKAESELFAQSITVDFVDAKAELERKLSNLSARMAAPDDGE